MADENINVGVNPQDFSNLFTAFTSALKGFKAEATGVDTKIDKISSSLGKMTSGDNLITVSLGLDQFTDSISRFREATQGFEGSSIAAVLPKIKTAEVANMQSVHDYAKGLVNSIPEIEQLVGAREVFKNFGEVSNDIAESVKSVNKVAKIISEMPRSKPKAMQHAFESVFSILDQPFPSIEPERFGKINILLHTATKVIQDMGSALVTMQEVRGDTANLGAIKAIFGELGLAVDTLTEFFQNLDKKQIDKIDYAVAISANLTQYINVVAGTIEKITASLVRLDAIEELDSSRINSGTFATLFKFIDETSKWFNKIGASGSENILRTETVKSLGNYVDSISQLLRIFSNLDSLAVSPQAIEASKSALNMFTTAFAGSNGILRVLQTVVGEIVPELQILFTNARTNLVEVLKSQGAMEFTEAISSLGRMASGLAKIGDMKLASPQVFQEKMKSLREFIEMIIGATTPLGKVMQALNPAKVNILSTLDAFSPQMVNKLKDFAESMRRLSLSLNNLKDFAMSGLDKSDIDKIMTSMMNITSLMTGMSRFSAFGSMVDNLRKGQFAPAIKSLTQIFAGRGGIFREISSIGETGNLNNFVEFIKSIGSFLKGVSGAVESMKTSGNFNENISKLQEAMSTMFSLFVEKNSIFGRLMGGGKFKGLIAEISQLSNSIGAGNLDGVSNLIISMARFVTSLSKVAVAESTTFSSEQVSNMVSYVSSVLNAFTKGSGSFIFKKKSILQDLTSIPPAAMSGAATFFKSVSTLFNAITKIGSGGLNEGVVKNVENNLPRLFRAIKNAAKEFDSKSMKKFAEINKSMELLNIGNSLKGPMKSIVPDFEKIGVDQGKAEIRGFNKGIEAASPSKAMIRAAGNLLDGLKVGLKKIESVLNLTIVTPLKKLQSLVGGIGSALGNAISAPFRAFGKLTDVFSNLGQKIFWTKQLFDSLLQKYNSIRTSTVEVFREFEWAFTSAQKTIDGTEQQFEQLFEGFREVTRDPSNMLSGIDNAFVKLSETAAAAGQLGIPIEQISEFTEVILLLEQATDGVSNQDLAFLLARLNSITGTGNFESVAGALVNLGNNFAATEGQIVEVVERIAGVAKSAGIAEPDILALATAVRAVGMEAELGGSSINQLIIRTNKALNDGGAKLEAFARLTNMTTDQFAEAWETDATSTLVTFIDELAKLSSRELTAFAEQAGLDGIRMTQFLSLISQSEGILADTLVKAREGYAEFGDTVDEYNAVQREAVQRSKTLTAANNRMRNSFKDLGFEIGKAMSPVVLKSYDSFAALFQRLRVFVQNNNEAFSRFFMSVSTLGSSILSLFGAVGQAIFMVIGESGKLFASIFGNFDMASDSAFSFSDALNYVSGFIEGVANRIQTLADRIKEFFLGIQNVLDPTKETRDDIARVQQEIDALAVNPDTFFDFRSFDLNSSGRALAQMLYTGFDLAWNDNIQGPFTEETRRTIGGMADEISELLSGYGDSGFVLPEHIERARELATEVERLYGTSTNPQTQAIGQQIREIVDNITYAGDGARPLDQMLGADGLFYVDPAQVTRMQELNTELANLQLTLSQQEQESVIKSPFQEIIQQISNDLDRPFGEVAGPIADKAKKFGGDLWDTVVDNIIPENIAESESFKRVTKRFQGAVDNVIDKIRSETRSTRLLGNQVAQSGFSVANNLGMIPELIQQVFGIKDDGTLPFDTKPIIQEVARVLGDIFFEIERAVINLEYYFSDSSFPKDLIMDLYNSFKDSIPKNKEEFGKLFNDLISKAMFVGVGMLTLANFGPITSMLGFIVSRVIGGAIMMAFSLPFAPILVAGGLGLLLAGAIGSKDFSRILDETGLQIIDGLFGEGTWSDIKAKAPELFAQARDGFTAFIEEIIANAGEIATTIGSFAINEVFLPLAGSIMSGLWQFLENSVFKPIREGSFDGLVEGLVSIVAIGAVSGVLGLLGSMVQGMIFRFFFTTLIPGIVGAFTSMIGAALTFLIANPPVAIIAAAAAFVGAFLFNEDFRNNILGGVQSVLEGVISLVAITVGTLQSVFIEAQIGVLDLAARVKDAVPGQSGDLLWQNIDVLREQQKAIQDLNILYSSGNPLERVTSGLGAYFAASQMGMDVSFIQSAMIDDVIKDAFSPRYISSALSQHFDTMVNDPTIQNMGGVEALIVGAIESGADPFVIQEAIRRNLAKLDETTLGNNRWVYEGIFERLFGTTNLGIPDAQKSIIEENVVQAIDDVIANIQANPAALSDPGAGWVSLGILDLEQIVANSNLTEDEKARIALAIGNKIKHALDTAPAGTFDWWDQTQIPGLWLGLVEGWNLQLSEEMDTMELDAVLNEFKRIYQIESPSKVFETFGQQLFEGLQIGMNANLPLIIGLLEGFKINIVNLSVEWGTRFLLMGASFWGFLATMQIATPLITFEIDKITDSFGKLVLTLTTVGELLTNFTVNSPGSPVQNVDPPVKAQFGATVRANNPYEILENNLPFELYRTGSGKTFLLPRENGRIISPREQRTVEPRLSNGPSYSSNDSSITIPVTIGSVNGSMSRQEAAALGEQIGEGIRKQITGRNGKRLTDRLTRAGSV